MNRRWMILLVIALVVGLSLGGWWLAQAARPEAAGYRLESGGLRAAGVSTGGNYRLEMPGATTAGSPCCCTYLPCIRR
jgi:hypothetical protein